MMERFFVSTYHPLLVLKPSEMIHLNFLDDDLQFPRIIKFLFLRCAYLFTRKSVRERKRMRVEKEREKARSSICYSFLQMATEASLGPANTWLQGPSV